MLSQWHYPGACSQCQGITSVIDKKESESITLSNDEKDDMKYIIQTAKEDIMAWIGHQLRLVNQEEAKTNVINQLDDKSVIMVQDWPWSEFLWNIGKHKLIVLANEDSPGMSLSSSVPEMVQLSQKP